jgi:hypothetical protein
MKPWAATYFPVIRCKTTDHSSPETGSAEAVWRTSVNEDGSRRNLQLPFWHLEIFAVLAEDISGLCRAVELAGISGETDMSDD